MKTTNIIKAFSWLCMSVWLLSACEKDGDTIYLSSPTSSELLATKSEVVLLQDYADEIAVAFTWTKSTVTISDESMGIADNQVTTYLEISTTEDFSGNVTETEVSGLQKTYKVAEINTLATNVGLQPEVATNVYFRLAASAGSNMDRIYSNVVNVKITTYRIDMSIGFILDDKKEMTEVRLSSPTENGIYTGFIGATGWMNFFLQEGDGTIWGNRPVDDTQFYASNSNPWNFWFPEPGGCYYVIVDTQTEQWSALYLPGLNVSGDLGNLNMEYDRANNRWTYVFDATSTTSLNIQLSTTGKQYNVSTGDKGTPIDTPVAFVQDGDKLAIAGSGGTINVSVSETGESTLIVDLSDPDNWTCKVVSGADVAEEIPEVLYLPGIDNLISGSWTFDNYVTLYDEGNLKYAGVFNVDSEWGYTINTEYNNWGDKYTWISGNAYKGTMAFNDQAEENIPAPAPGIYLVDISTKALTYELLELGNEVYVQGLNDEWTFDVLLTSIAPGIYSGPITIESISPWGFRINLKNGEWNNYQFGGTDGKLYYEGSSMTDDAELAPGTYTMTVDLINQTYTIEE